MLPVQIENWCPRIWDAFILDSDSERKLYRETRFYRSATGHSSFAYGLCEMHKVAIANFAHENRNWVLTAISKTNMK